MSCPATFPCASQIAVASSGDLSDNNYEAVLQYIRQRDNRMYKSALHIAKPLDPAAADAALHRVQDLLMQGNRPGAMNEAAAANLWDQALLIATMVSKAAYQVRW